VPSPISLLQLEYFVAAVERGSFSAAAEALHVAQPSLSEQIRRLEVRLGVVLFQRTNRRLVLTRLLTCCCPARGLRWRQRPRRWMPCDLCGR
jgi:hypothetical protein